jgi:hypothetical protein
MQIMSNPQDVTLSRNKPLQDRRMGPNNSESETQSNKRQRVEQNKTKSMQELIDELDLSVSLLF